MIFCEIVCRVVTDFLNFILFISSKSGYVAFVATSMYIFAGFIRKSLFDISVSTLLSSTKKVNTFRVNITLSVKFLGYPSFINFKLTETLYGNIKGTDTKFYKSIRLR